MHVQQSAGGPNATTQGDGSNPHRVLSFRQWCQLNGFSEATGRRVINGGQGPVVTQLSPRRIGITVGANLAWQASRARTA